MQRGKCYGSTTIGERGQVVIPVEAREELKLTSGEKLIVFGKPGKGFIVMIKADAVAEFLNSTIEALVP